MRVRTSTRSRPTWSANSFRMGNVATTLTRSAAVAGGGSKVAASAMHSAMAKGLRIGRDGSILILQSQRTGKTLIGLDGAAIVNGRGLRRQSPDHQNYASREIKESL